MSHKNSADYYMWHILTNTSPDMLNTEQESLIIIII
jgi:hypothetical protein